MIKTRLFILAILLVFNTFVFADTCPSSEDIKNRKVPNVYEWTVNYEMALDDLLSVTKLYAVSIENHGEFVSCRYLSPRREVRVDGVSKTKNCLITVDMGNWFIMDNGKIICQEDELNRCQYKNDCFE